MRDILKKKIVILDGATGTAIQNYNLDKFDYNFEGVELTGCHEILNINRKDIITDIHKKYIEAGADIIETNTFNANLISLREYKIENLTYKLAYEGAKIASEAASFSERKVWVAGSMGPTSKSASIPTKKNPISREVDFDELLKAYKLQAEGLIDGGVDIFLIETIFDGLNAKAAVIACEEAALNKGKEVPIMISATVDKGGRLLSGQDMFSLVRAIDRDSIVSFGLNCSFGAKDLVPLVEELGKATDKCISIYPNAGLPNAEGEYDEAPEVTLNYLKPLIDNGKINIIGGCCGTTAKHIELLSNYSIGKEPRTVNKAEKEFFLSGSAALSGGVDFYVVGERNNVAGSRKFKRLIEEKKYEEALEISRTQIEKGAQIIDINLDDALLESETEMETFLKILGNDAYTSKVPVMIDSSDFNIIEKALKIIPGRAIVNSISLKEGEEDFLEKARVIKKFGAAVVVMAFDEKGQAVSFENKIEIAERAYKLLTKNGFKGKDIVFDTNILTIGTGRDEDRYHAVSFIKSVKWIKENLSGAKTSGGISNLSFAFRGNNLLRKVIHQMFIERAVENGLSMAIINPEEKIDDIPKDLEIIVEKLLNGEDVVDEILNYEFAGAAPKIEIKEKLNQSVEERLKSAILKGGSSTFDADVDEALLNYSPLNLIQTVLMDAMQIVGDKFEAGELYLPQIIRSASVMERAVAILTPLMEAESVGTSSRGKIQMCTVRGDVHDIGKNITGTVLRCNGYEVIDLGVMVDKQTIIEQAVKNNVDIVTLSGLITPSLTEMQEVVSLFEEKGMKLPILIGGAATSRLHTSLKIEPKYHNRVFHVTDASSTLPVVAELLGESVDEYVEKTMKSYEVMRTAYLNNQKNKVVRSIEEARKDRKQLNYTPIPPKKNEIEYLEIPIETLEPLMDWDIFLSALKVKGTPYEEKSMAEARELLTQWKNEGLKSKAIFGIYPATREDDTIQFAEVKMVLFRNQGKTNESLADYIEEEDYIGAFVASIKAGDNNNIIHQLLANTLAEATSEYLEAYITKTNWTVKLRPAIGYPCLPDHTGKKDIFKLLDGEKTGAELSPNFAMSPGSTVCGIYLGNPQSEYINPRTILEDQISEMAETKGISIDEMKKYLSVIL